VPGSLSNEPPAPARLAPLPAKTAAANSGKRKGGTGAAPQPTTRAAGSGAPLAPVGAVGAGGPVLSRNVIRNYEIDRTLDYSREPPGQVRRLSVAVLVGYRPVKAANGKVTQVPLSAAELARITQLVKDAVGFNPARGDSVSVVNEPLTLPSVAGGRFVRVPIWERPLFLTMMKIGVGLIALLTLVLAVLRPLVRSLFATTIAPAAALQVAHEGPQDGPGAATKDAPVKALSHEQQLASARAIVGQDPKRVAQLVRGWVGNDE
jgi:flagellar M-ring protein FliF